MNRLLTFLLLLVAIGIIWACPHNKENLVKTKVWDGDRHYETYLDKCIAPIVSALYNAGIATRSSCCGHGTGWGYILLSNRVLIITPESSQSEADSIYYKYFEAGASTFGNPSRDDIMRRDIDSQRMNPTK